MGWIDPPLEEQHRGLSVVGDAGELPPLGSEAVKHLAHALPTPDETSEAVFLRSMNQHFGGPVDVLVMGHSHLDGVTRFGGTLIVNPGSATLPRNLVDVPGTVAILEITAEGAIAAEIVSLA